jgi:hypothetical protein
MMKRYRLLGRQQSKFARGKYPNIGLLRKRDLRGVWALLMWVKE